MVAPGSQLPRRTLKYINLPDSEAAVSCIFDYNAAVILPTIMDSVFPSAAAAASQSVQTPARWQTMGNEEKKAVVHEEMKRMNKLPTNSSYAIHRLRVLNKILQLLSVPRTLSQDEELELLFAGLRL